MGKAFRNRFWGSSLLIGCIVLAAPAIAQEAPAEPAASENGVDDIVVTARRRAESIQSVPIAMTALSGEALEERGVVSLGEIGRSAPNVTFDGGQGVTGGSSSASVYIRGIGQNESSPTADPGVGVYVDGVYLGRSVGSLLDVLDLQRVEVLRGPQGTLFGKNTIGGAVALYSVQPEPEFHGSITGELGRFNERNVRGMLNVPLAEGLAARVNLSYRKRDGYGRSLITGQDFGDIDSFAGRGSLKWSSSNFRFLLQVDGTRQRQNGQFLKTVTINPVLPAVTQTFNALVASRTPFVAYDRRWLTSSPYTNNAGDLLRSNMDVIGGSATAEWDLDDNITATSITAYRKLDTDIAVDADNSPLRLAVQSFKDRQTQFSQELRLDGKSLGNSLNWTIGGYYFKEDIQDFARVGLVLGLYQATGNAATDRNTYLEFHPVNETFAVYGQATLSVTPELSFTAGARYNRDNKVIDAFTYTPDSNGVGIPRGTRVTQGWNSFTPRLGIEFQARQNLLLYASYAKGFKSGGVNYQVGTPSDFLPYDPETAGTYEAGFKSDLLDRTLRFNGAIFQTDYRDFQLRYRAGAGQFACPATAAACSIVVNAAAVRIRGVEFEATARPVPEFEVNAVLGYTQNKFVEIDPLLLAGNVANFGTQLPKTPEWTWAVGAQYEASLGQAGSLILRGDYSYRSADFQEISNSAFLKQKGYGLLSARLAYRLPIDGIEVAISGKNLTNEAYFTSGSFTYTALGYVDAAMAAPRTWTASVRFAF